MPPPGTPCRNGISCAFPGCWFAHPPGHVPVAAEPAPCRYGAACQRPGCRFVHPEGRPDSLPGAPARPVCVWFQKGRCRSGAACQFSHEQQERDANVVVVRNLPRDGSPEELSEAIGQHFGQCGVVCRAQVKADLDGRCRGFAFVIFADVSQAASAVKLGHSAWDVRLKTDLPMYIEGDGRASRKTSALADAAPSAPLRYPFTRSDRVLLVGEGNFSYSAAAVSSGHLSPSLAIATSNERPRTESYLDKLKQAGADCRFDVDATWLPALGPFDVVVFNHPHTGEPSIEENRELLRGFFSSAAAVLRPGGRIAVTLKQTWPYSEWGLTDCAASAGLELVDSFPFAAAAMQRLGYQHTTTDNIPHQVEALASAKTCIFSKESLLARGN